MSPHMKQHIKFKIRANNLRSLSALKKTTTKKYAKHLQFRYGVAVSNGQFNEIFYTLMKYPCYKSFILYLDTA
jgi:hypothetical protein